MREIKATKSRGKRVRIELEDGDTLTLPTAVVFQYGIFPGYLFDDHEWLAILQDAEAQACYDKLLDLISRRPHSETEMQRKLRQREFPAPLIQSTLARAKESGLLDDAIFAKLYIEEKERLTELSRGRIVADLRKRGITRQIIEDALYELEEEGQIPTGDHERDKAMRAATRKWEQLAREEDPYKRREKLLRFLAGRGFTADLCYGITRELANAG
ncbi:MAG: regulatory protein [Rhodothermales bacterium]|jgi:regulatory protein